MLDLEADAVSVEAEVEFLLAVTVPNPSSAEAERIAGLYSGELKILRVRLFYTPAPNLCG